MQFNIEPLSLVYSDIQALLPDHYEELTLNKDKIKLDPDWNRYFELENNRGLIIFTARDDQKKLCGYAFFFIGKHIHYKSITVATNDVVYLTKECRSGITGAKFLKYCHTNLLPLADKISFHIKDSNDFSPILTKWLGYDKEDTLYGFVK